MVRDFGLRSRQDKASPCQVRGERQKSQQGFTLGRLERCPRMEIWIGHPFRQGQLELGFHGYHSISMLVS